MAKEYRRIEAEYEKSGQFDRDLNDEHRTFDARDIGEGYTYLPSSFGESSGAFSFCP